MELLISGGAGGVGGETDGEMTPANLRGWWVLGGYNVMILTTQDRETDWCDDPLIIIHLHLRFGPFPVLSSTTCLTSSLIHPFHLRGHSSRNDIVVTRNRHHRNTGPNGRVHQRKKKKCQKQ